MGAKQSRVVAPETAAELRPEDDYEAETQTSIRLTPALVDQINGTHEASKSAKQAVSGLTPQYGTCAVVLRACLVVCYLSSTDCHIAIAII